MKQPCTRIFVDRKGVLADFESDKALVRVGLDKDQRASVVAYESTLLFRLFWEDGMDPYTSFGLDGLGEYFVCSSHLRALFLGLAQ